jgi:hypothetical protein
MLGDEPEGLSLARSAEQDRWMRAVVGPGLEIGRSSW